MKIVLNLIGILVAMLFAAMAAFISSLYSILIMWIVSLIIIIASPVLGYINRTRLRILICALLSFIINFNFLIHIPYGNPTFEIAFYGACLFTFIFIMLCIISGLAKALKEARPHGPA